MSLNTQVTLAHDSFTQFGGAERVAEALHSIYPEAPMLTLVVDKQYKNGLRDWNIKTSILQHLYFLMPRMQYWLPLIPLAVFLIRSKSPILLSSSSSFIRNIRTKKNTIHINYCHTPARFLWTEDGYALAELPWQLKPFYPVLKIFLNWMKYWDFKAAQRVTYFIANSKEVQRRIKLYYKRESIVIPSFVDTLFWRKTTTKKAYFLIAGRLHAHKNNELVIKIFNELGLELHVVGTGRQESYLKSISKSNIHFFGKVSDADLRDQYSGAIGFIYPQLEDFGMMPLEAAACGTATLGLALGGSLETIIPGVTGELFLRPEHNLVLEAIKKWDQSKYSEAQLIAHANTFSKINFSQKVQNFVTEVSQNSIL